MQKRQLNKGRTKNQVNKCSHEFANSSIFNMKPKQLNHYKISISQEISNTMGKPTGFLEFTRELPAKRPVQERVNDYNEFIERYTDEKLNQQAARCMDCGIPFCHSGCPLGNVIPEFNDAVYRKSWKEAYDILTFHQ